jgi:Lamin Tail Domain/Bacterial Ig-like domain
LPVACTDPAFFSTLGRTLYMKKKLTVVLLVCGLYANAQPAISYQLLITEIMADPAPPVALPNAEFIEVKNTGVQAINLNGWHIGDAGNLATISSNFVLAPDSFVVLCSNSAAPLLAAYGAVLGVSNFPSLDNNAELLYLQSKEGRTIHAVSYSSAWYQNSVKGQGGWSLEMIDTHNPCSGASNWTASNAAAGGTPGKRNSVEGTNADLQPPALLQAFASDSLQIILSFDEPLDSAASVNPASYSISDGIGTSAKITAVAPLFNQIALQTGSPLQPNRVYTVTVQQVSDCAGNNIGAYNKVKLGRATIPEHADLVINEILFNPKPDGTDYVELYNRSNLNIDLNNCFIATRSASGLIGTPKALSASNRLLFPGEYMVITEDEQIVKKQYLAKDPDAFAVISSMPSLPDDKGNLVILNGQGKILDELSYDAGWHFKLIDNAEGVALERINYNKPTQDAANWHSAATSAGYGTPGYTNSQLYTAITVAGTLHIVPTVFSPDNDGLDDFCTLQYQFPEPGYVCNSIAFDANGRPVRQITRNALCGLQGYFRWDGLDDNNLKLPVGVYVVLTDVFNLQGKTKRFKQAVTLARRL